MPHVEPILVGDPASPDTEVFVGRDVLDANTILPPSDRRQAVAILTQPGRASAYASTVAKAIRSTGLRVEITELPDRDAAKALNVVGDTCLWLSEIGMGRADTIVAVGGGALTDVAGFVAAVYLRGIESVYVSTTLLGAVDASVGGKTGVNNAGKNLVGAFWHPRRVVIDLDTLATLPDAVLREGLAETVKTGFIADTSIVDACEASGRHVSLDVVVPASVRVKARVVTDDFREAGLRAILNYGHTIGHAIETAAGISHGDAVGIGMIAAGAVSEARAGFDGRERHDRVIADLGLPTAAPSVDPTEVRRLIAVDKKRVAGTHRMVLLEDFGRPVVMTVDDDAIDIGLRAIGVIG